MRGYSNRVTTFTCSPIRYHRRPTPVMQNSAGTAAEKSIQLAHGSTNFDTWTHSYRSQSFQSLRVFTLVTQWQKIDACVKNLWSVWTDNLMLSIGCHVDFDARASKFWQARQKFWRRPANVKTLSLNWRMSPKIWQHDFEIVVFFHLIPWIGKSGRQFVPLVPDNDIDTTKFDTSPCFLCLKIHVLWFKFKMTMQDWWVEAANKNPHQSVEPLDENATQKSCSQSPVYPLFIISFFDVTHFQFCPSFIPSWLLWWRMWTG